jgi:AmmeMemoRadiSam system protein A
VRAQGGSAAEDRQRAEEDALLLETARRAIALRLATGRSARSDPGESAEALQRPGACFVTLRSPTGVLRGCIGSMEPHRALVEDVAQNALAAATRDPRMARVTAEELDDLRIEISILSPLEEIPADSLAELIAQLRPGRDGLLLADLGHRGTLLPQVWSQLPDARDFAGAVWRKAGLPADHWSGSARAWRFTVRSIADA